MRLDRFLSECGIATRSETSRACRAGAVTVNGKIAPKPDCRVEPETDSVIYRGRQAVYRRFVYIMLNKPDGYVSATEDGKDPTVTDLLPEEYRRIGVFPCGRLDKHTLGLMLLTNNGELAHRLLAPKSHVTKCYAFEIAHPISDADITVLESGVDIGGYVTHPCRITMEGSTRGRIAITEGKYHQIKRMMETVGTRITALERLKFGPLSLDSSLARGEWRLLTAEEERALESHGNKTNRGGEPDGL